MAYEHTQRAPLYLIVLAVAAVLLAMAWRAQADPVLAWMLPAVAAAIVVIGLSFKHLTVRDERDALAVRYGPLPLIRTRIPYASIRDARRSRSTLLDGWGVHWVPGRGWTYNLWGFDCVELTVNGKTVRIGTDDPEGLLGFLTEKLSQRQSA